VAGRAHDIEDPRQCDLMAGPTCHFAWLTDDRPIPTASMRVPSVQSNSRDSVARHGGDPGSVQGSNRARSAPPDATVCCSYLTNSDCERCVGELRRRAWSAA
jgi:hypothetical protein